MAKETNIDELFIIQKMIGGDIAAFKYFFDKYYDDLSNFVNIYLHDPVLSEEIVQDIFVYFWESKEKLQITSSVKSYLYSASKFRSLNLLRDARNRKRVIDHIGKTEPAQVQEPDQMFIDSGEFRKILEAAIDQLAPKCREIFLLSKKHELSNREIAEQLGISVKTVENQMTIALKKLREFLLPFRSQIFLFFLFWVLS